MQNVWQIYKIINYNLKISRYTIVYLEMSGNIMDMELDTYNIGVQFIIFIKNCLVITGVIVGGITLGSVVVSSILFGEIHKNYKLIFGYDSDSSDSSDSSDCDKDTESERIKIEFAEKYLEEYNELIEKEIDNEELKLFKERFLEEETPNGIIKLSYDVDTESFIYFADTKDIPYSFLETIGRAFVIKNNCKCIFIDSKLELNKANKQIEELKKNIIQKEQEQEEVTKTTSIFAQLKTYSTNISDKKNENIVVIPEKSNHYIYKGNLKEYDKFVF